MAYQLGFPGNSSGVRYRPACFQRSLHFASIDDGSYLLWEFENVDVPSAGGRIKFIQLSVCNHEGRLKIRLESAHEF